MRVDVRPDGRFDVTQSFIPPTVYLDHWAVRDLTDNRTWQDRFVGALKRSNGTLLVSYLTFAEFAHVGDVRHAAETEAFLDRVFPNIFIASIDLGPVFRREFANLSRPFEFLAPPADAGLIQHFVSKKPSMSFVDMIQPISRSLRLRTSARRVNMAIAERINEVRRAPEFIKASKSFRDHEPRAPALTVFRELARIPGTDSNMRIVANDGADLQHAIVALAYCDYALLDRKWADFGQRVRRQLLKLGFRNKLAEVFSKRDVTIFLDALDREPNQGLVRTGA
jgi:hypothetical protein